MNTITTFAIICTSGLIVLTSAVYMSPDMPDYDMEAHRAVIERISEMDKSTKVKPVKLYKVKEPKRMDAREVKLTYLFLYGTDKESAKARQLLAGK